MFQIVTDGSCDLEQALVEQYQLHVVPFYISKDGLTPVSYTHLRRVI